MVCNMIFLLEFFSFFEFVNDSVCTLSEIHFPCTMVVIVVYPRMMYYIANRMIRKIKRHFLTGGRKNTNDHIILLEGKMCIAAICQYRSCHKVKECVQANFGRKQKNIKGLSGISNAFTVFFFFCFLAAILEPTKNTRSSVFKVYCTQL